MDFRETDEQAMIRQMVRDFAEEVLAPTAALRDKEQRPPLAEWESFCQLGLQSMTCLLYTSPSPRDVEESRMPSSA